MKRELTQNEEMVFSYLSENGSSSDYKEVFFKGIITKTGLIRAEINIILNELEKIGLISIDKQKNPNNNYSKWFYKLSQPQNKKEKNTIPIEEVVDEIVNNEIIYAAVDEDEYLARYKGYCKWAVREIYNADVIGLIESRIKNYRGGNLNSDDIEYIIDEADVNARKNTIKKLRGGFIEETFVAHLTKSTLERIMINEFISNKPTIIDLIAETFDEYNITIVDNEKTKSVA